MKNILITGGTGSLGRAFISRAQDVSITVLSRDEKRQAETRALFPHCRYVLGDVAKIEDLERVMYGIDTVLHFAAYKVVPSSQANVAATFTTNITGSENVARAAVRYGVETVVGVSTDKSCQPVNYYGASKMAMEGLFQEANNWGKTKFVLTRYGNVVCSNQSVIPLFMRQKALGGPLTVTDFDMTRFWISLDDAVDLVLLAMQQEPGTITVPKAGAMSMGDLAAAIANGLVMQEIGARPGEKKHEMMVHESESLHTEEFEDHFVIHPAVSKVINEKPFTYTSNNPKVWLTYKQILEMMPDEINS